jgi:probable F420-dependent oxidoreductase
MHFGVYGINVGVCALDPQALPRLVRAIEDAGWESAWVGEHYVLPDPPTPQSPAGPGTPMLDPFVALAVAATHTSRILLGTSIIVVPLHNPLVLAKQVASIDRVSGGRFALGVGVGYLEPEFRALGVPLESRGARTDEYLDAMRAVWSRQPYNGSYATFSGVRAVPVPLRPDGTPLHVGGHSPAAYRRAVARGAGWYGYNLTPTGLASCIDGLRAAAYAVDRPANLGPLEITVSPPQDAVVDPALVRAYQAQGVTRLALLPPAPAMREAGDLLGWFARTADLLR